MLRSVLAILLIAGWIVLSGIDLIEDLAFPAGPSVHRSAARIATGLSKGGALANNLVESADRPRAPLTTVAIRGTAVLLAPAPVALLRNLKLHKLNRVFLI
ncbi:MAG TPA: hypothetical protein VNN77_00730 [candidate division Zixibacteria bacterium]|nr:hypothetical protein [candidate division Zixibacteria bacterium]